VQPGGLIGWTGLFCRTELCQKAFTSGCGVQCQLTLPRLGKERCNGPWTHRSAMCPRPCADRETSPVRDLVLAKSIWDERIPPAAEVMNATSDGPRCPNELPSPYEYARSNATAGDIAGVSARHVRTVMRTTTDV